MTTTVLFHAFADLPLGDYKFSPSFSSLGHSWRLRLDPGGVKVGLDYLPYTTQCPIKVQYQILNNYITHPVSVHSFSTRNGASSEVFINRSTVMRYLVSGTMRIDIRMASDSYRPRPHPGSFIPSNPSVCKTIQDSFMNEESSDVVFEVGNDQGGGGSRTKFYAHYYILNKAAPFLAELCKSDDLPSRIQLPNESPEIIKVLLLYMYGLQPTEFGNDVSRTKKIIEAANKYGVTNLKIEAEAHIFSSATFTLANVLDYLYFADSKNCALLKEKALEFIVNNPVQIVEKQTLEDAPASLVNDILLAIAMKDRKGEGFDLMSISELRRLSHEKGLDIDGTREMLIAGLKKK